MADAVQKFSYSTWSPETIVTLANVTWNNDYRDTQDIQTGNEVDEFIDEIGRPVSFKNLSYAKPDRPVKLDISLNEIDKYNYLRAHNPSTGVPGDQPRSFYYFIVGREYEAPNTTKVILQLDVWASYMDRVRLGNCYIVGGHIGIANEDNFDNFGRTFLSVPEGLDIGGEYMHVHTEFDGIMGTFSSGSFTTFDVLVTSSIDLNADPGEVFNPALPDTANNPPKINSAKGGRAFGMVSGAAQYVFDGSGGAFDQFLLRYSRFPWVTNGILNVTLVPKVTRYYPTFTYVPYSASNNPSGATRAPEGAPERRPIEFYADWRNSTRILEHIPKRYRHLKKFLTSPYTMMELTVNAGTPIYIKPECWNNADARVIERMSYLAPNQRVVITPESYNAKYNVNIGINTDGGEDVNFSTIAASFPTVAILNNEAINYLAGSSGARAFGISSADWSQQRALAASQTSYDQAGQAVSTESLNSDLGRWNNTAQTAQANELANKQALLKGVGDIVGGAVGGAGVKGAGGAAAGAGMGAASAFASMYAQQMSAEAASKSTQTANMTSKMQSNASAGLGNYVRDTNKSLADWAAKGDYANTIAGMNAKTQDATLAQPSISGQVGGDAFNLLNHRFGTFLKWKMLDEANMTSIGEHWLRYGYKVHRRKVIGRQFSVMEKFTYWQLSETYLAAADMPETFKQTIRGIFEKGVTIWKDARDIGMIDYADNAPLEGIKL